MIRGLDIVLGLELFSGCRLGNRSQTPPVQELIPPAAGRHLRGKPFKGLNRGGQMRHISLQFTHSSCKSLGACGRASAEFSGEADAIRRELNAHNEVQRARYRKHAASRLMTLAPQGRSHLNALGVA